MKKLLSFEIGKKPAAVNKTNFPPFIVSQRGRDSSVNLVVRTWSKADDLWPVYFEMNEKVYKEFPKHGLNIPFPQMDVHVHNDK